MIKIIIYFVFCLSVLLPVHLFSQYTQRSKATIADGNITLTKDLDVSGTPFLFDNWRRGAIILPDKSEFKNLMLKFDISTNRFLYNRNDSSFYLSSDISEVIIYDSSHHLVFSKVINLDKKISKDNFVQVLSQGTITVFKEFKKRIEGENSTNGYNTTEKKYITHIYLWFLKNGKPTPIKLSNKFLEEITADKKEQVINYVVNNKLNPKNEGDFILAIEYYNNITR